ncbi:hypothetical protein ACLOJK_040247 [Asimina triloba]
MSVSMDVGSDGVAVISFYNPPLNALSPPLIAGLKEKYAEAMRSDAVKAIVLTGKAGVYSSGFDINALQNAQKTDAKKPSVAAIQGLAFGGGLELAMACHARIATPEVQLGLPELTLGITPGFGGTQRLPRLVGIPKAIEMILSSKSIMSKEGKKLGLIDVIVSSEELLTASRCWALDISDRHKARTSSLRRTDKLCSLTEAHEILMLARQSARQIIPNLPHYLECLEAVGEGIFFGGYAGILKEAEIFTKLLLSSTSRDLVCAFFVQCANAQNVRDSESVSAMARL